MTKNHKLLSLTLILSLILGILIFAAGCGKSEPAPAEETAAPKSDVDLSDAKDVGDGDTQFYFVAVDRDENETVYLVHTDEKTIGEALEDVDLIETEERDYGMYVAEVDGEEADYVSEGEYWALFVDGEYCSESIDSLKIDEDAVYLMRIEKAW